MIDFGGTIDEQKDVHNFRSGGKEWSQVIIFGGLCIGPIRNVLN